MIVNCLLKDKVTPTRDYKTRSPFLRHRLKPSLTVEETTKTEFFLLQPQYVIINKNSFGIAVRINRINL